MSVVGPIRIERAPKQGVPSHAYAELFPWIEGEAQAAFVEDVRRNGVIEPIVFMDDAILDGRNRYTAARQLGIAYPAVDFQGDDALAFVLAKNLARRHLTESQRAMVAGKLATMPQGARTDLAPVGAMSDAQAATLLSVSERSVERSKVVHRDAVPALSSAVQAGEVSVSAAADLATLPKPEQEQIVARGEAEIMRAAKVIRTARQAEKRDARTQREATLAQRQRALPDSRYGVILADPPWRFEPYSRESGMDRAADNHYPTGDLASIEALNVASIAADDCALFLWATAPMLPQQLDVMAAWGFAYKSQFIWRKDRTGTGYWNRNEHELLLVGTRGNVPAPAPGTQWPSVIDAPVGEHSAKPEKFLQLVESYFPNLPKIELNRRGAARAGWDCWGLEACP